jgi:RNA polymerase sigma-70 factor (ECF subfamily)
MNYEGLDEAQLLSMIQREDRQALEALYDRYGGAVYSLAMRMLSDSGAAQEVTQDTFFNIWRRASSYHPRRGKVTAWLFSIAHHRTIDELRRRRRVQDHVQHGVDLSNKPSDGADDPVAYATAQYERSQLKEALHTLRVEQREVVVLAYFGGLTHSEIASHLGQPLGTVKTRMRLGLRKLREVLGPQARESADHGL